MTDQTPQTPIIPPTLPEVSAPAPARPRGAAVLATILCLVDLYPLAVVGWLAVETSADATVLPLFLLAFALLLATGGLEVAATVGLWHNRPRSRRWLLASQIALVLLGVGWFLGIYISELNDTGFMARFATFLYAIFFGPVVLMHVILGGVAVWLAWRASVTASP